MSQEDGKDEDKGHDDDEAENENGNGEKDDVNEQLMGKAMNRKG